MRPPVQLAQANRVAGYWEQLNDQLHKALEELAKQKRRSEQAQAVAAAAESRAYASERRRAWEREQFRTYVDQLLEEHREVLHEVTMNHRQALVNERKRHTEEVEELLARNAGLLQQLAEARRNNTSQRRRGGQGRPAADSALGAWGGRVPT